MRKNTSSIHEALANRVLLIDGSMGTLLQQQGLSANDFGGEKYNGCNEHLVLTRPDIVTLVHESYLKAGADIIETNTFGATPLVLLDYNLESKAYEINFAAAQLAKKACKVYSTSIKPRFVAGSMGPTTKSLSLTGGVTFNELIASYRSQAIPLINGGCDYLLLETAMDTLNLKAAYCGISEAFRDVGKSLPIAISVTIEATGTMLAGQDIEAVYYSLEHIKPLYFGINCAMGPAQMKTHIHRLATVSQFPIALVPNAGMPDANGNYQETPALFSKIIEEYLVNGWLNIVGGCCGTTPEHISRLQEVIASLPSKARINVSKNELTALAGLETLYLSSDERPYFVGERANVIGSRAFKDLISAQKFDAAADVARNQIKNGAHIIDICVSNPDRDEIADIYEVVSRLAKVVKIPLMIDSQNPKTVEIAFQLIQGKCVLNSINLENDGKTLHELMPLVKHYGAAVVVGCIKDDMALTAESKLAIAKDAYTILQTQYNIAEIDILFDPLVFPCATGDQKYLGSGKETIEGIRLIKQTFPACKTVLGISNISFGLPLAGREALNSAFLYHCTLAGLDVAIVHVEKIRRYSSLSHEEKQLCDHLLFNQGQDPIAAFVAFYREKKTVAQTVFIHWETLSLPDRINRHLIEGTQEYLTETMDIGLKTYAPLELVNGLLLQGMAKVGQLFNANQLIVAEVLQSAEVMKAAVTYLEQFMDQTQNSSRATMLLATVKGDVHDIGKNLVNIIFSNNGYKVIDIGIKCDAENIVAACVKHNPDLIGLSGLLVKSALQMETTAHDLKAAGISVPLLVGGAALSQTFTQTRIATAYNGSVYYCKDAMAGLAIAMELTASAKPIKNIITPHHNPMIIEGQLQDIWPFLNETMIYNHHLGYRGNFHQALATNDPKAKKLVDQVERVKERIANEDLFKPKAIYQFFSAKSQGQELLIFDHEGQKIIERFIFPRQDSGARLCLADYVSATNLDSVAFFVATAGIGIAELAKQWINMGEYVNAHILFALGLETAEAFAEFVHAKIRNEWGLTPLHQNKEDILKGNYQGKRYSFGYSACPNLEDQTKLWNLIEPSKHIGVSLTETYMMLPEASVSALVIHNANARYF